MAKRTFHIPFNRSADHSIDYLLGMLHDTRLTTLHVISQLSIEELHWQYREGWNTIGALLAHLAALEHFFRIEYIEQRKLTAEENSRWEPALDMGVFLPQLITQQGVAAYQAALSESRQRLLQSIEKLTFEQFARKLEGYDAESGCNLAWVLYHMVEDEIYHRGQMSILRKLYKNQHG